MSKAFATLIIMCLAFGCKADPKLSTIPSDDILGLLKQIIYKQDVASEKLAFRELERHWEEGMIAPLVEIMRFSSSKDQLNEINSLLHRKTDQRFTEFFEWMQWMWDIKLEVKPYYYDFKAEIYKHVDERFEKYFTDRNGQATIRLDEVVWGGVLQDGIPPLRYPMLSAASAAEYLSDSDVVFGAYINGVAKAYPKRILAWHEMFVDKFGEDIICGVYCTLCGTVIAYDTKHNGKHYDLGTSGFLYRSNKLMYDQATQSLWNTIEGKPVLGPLHDSGVELEVRPIVTTTWGEWKKVHPDTKVLTLETGHLRDYGEGVAYQNYFATDELMFPVPNLDKKLKNKDEVLIVRVDGLKDDPLAISINYLKKERFHQDKINNTSFLVLSDKVGTARVYQDGGHQFKSYKKGNLLDQGGNKWKVSHDKLEGPGGEVLSRLPSHNIFWFAWYNTYPNSRLIK